MLPTIPQRICAACLLVLCATPCARAQPADPALSRDPFARGRWHFETAVHGAIEAWNYNTSHEELYGIEEGVTYGIRDGLVFTATQRIYYVSQRAQDTWLLALTAGLRKRVWRRGRASAFVGFDVGISDAAIAAPPRGTRFNYLGTGSGGTVVRLNRRLQLIADLQWIHVSNNSLKGPGRNPDIEAIGPRVGFLLGF